MFSKIKSAGLLGIEGYIVEVEADVSPGLPYFRMVGYLASEVKEAEERVRTSIRNSGFSLSPMKVTVNLSPANIRKEGTSYDLPVAVAVLSAYGVVCPTLFADSGFLGEVGLDGSLKPVRGVLSMVSAMKTAGLKRCFLPEGNQAEGCAVSGIDIIKAADLQQLVELLNQPEQITVEILPAEMEQPEADYDVDFSEVNGQMLVRRAVEVAVAGRHNLLCIGPPGSGKSMIAKRIPTIMPELSREEQLEVSKIYSICGLLPPGKPLLSTRPFRSPHHTVSSQALIGGGRIPKPGEISLASRGVLFLDELPEFQKSTLELLRQPLEDHKVTIARVYGTYEFPAHTMLAAAMNIATTNYLKYNDRIESNMLYTA